MNVIMEGCVLAALLYLFCLVGIRNGAVQLVHLYEKDVQDRALELGLITAEKIKKNAVIFKSTGVVIYLAYPLVCVYGINGARGFISGFWQITAILLIMGVFDRIVIDVIWVGHTKAWIIPGTEDLRPYIPAKVHAKKWIMTLVVYPAVTAILAGIMALVLR
ncbi:MAG: hypothetical protein IJ049_02025 [Oscillospiraceae bacterium]|nr:hypothetical protein [Oscillospiraceae bacterium]